MLTRFRLSPRALRARYVCLFGITMGIGLSGFETSTGVASEPGAPTDPDRFFVYVSVGQENRISIFQMLPETGRLVPIGHVELSGSPGSLCVNPHKKLLYAAVRSAHSVATFEMDSQTGGLTPLGMVPVAGDPVYVSMDRSGRWLLTAYFQADRAAIYPIRNDGSVGRHATQVLDAIRNPHSIQTDASNRFVFLPNTGADLIQQFRFDAESGTLAPNAVPAVATPQGAGPRHFFFHPQKKEIVYFINEKNSSVTTYRLDALNGRITPLETVFTLPSDYRGRNTCADVEVTPSGKYLYGSNRGHDSIAAFSIDESTGLLTPMGQVPTEKTPREFNIDPTGRYLFAAGEGSGRLAGYRIDPDNGRLHPLDVYKVGAGPSWVLIVRQARG